ncbi:MAG: HEAT repeat domain-containing protein [Planctomycetota bacterium]|nr:HEAT repeat domain-containing protein [Planctomycetota bacterium]
MSDDLSKWQYWWEFNKDPFINLKEAIHAPEVVTGSDEYFLGALGRRVSIDKIKPSESDIQDVILPALRRAMVITENRDILSSCIVAMAKIGRDQREFEILQLFADSLGKHDQEIRETAALAMGISGLPKAHRTLIDLAMDRPAGRRLVPGREVSVRTRSFAIYGLGLLAHRTGKIDLKRVIFEELATLLGDARLRNRNLKVAAIQAISILNLQVSNPNDKEQRLISDALSSLEAFYDRRAGRGQDLIKSHVPPAIAKLLGRGNSPVHQRFKNKFLTALTARKKRGNDIYRAATIALGKMALSADTLKSEQRFSEALLKYFHNGRDQQTRFFALMALGQIGGAANRNRLRTVLRKGRKSLDRPWAALGLGVMRHFALRGANNPRPDTAVGDDLLKQFQKIRDPQARGAIAIALGLGKYQSAAPVLQAALEKYAKNGAFAGYLCIGLALMDHKGSREQIHEIVRGAIRRPNLLQQAAVSLGKLGDRSVTETLMVKMSAKEPNLAKLSAIATALGFIGDRRTIRPLKKMLFDDKLTPLSRAFAAVALGGVADKEMLPWSAKLSRDVNYRAAVETLTQSGTGVLDIL